MDEIYIMDEGWAEQIREAVERAKRMADEPETDEDREEAPEQTDRAEQELGK